MRKRLLYILPLILMFALVVFVAGCGGSESPESHARKEVGDNAKAREPYVPHNNVEFDNYNKAQRLYDDPSTIIWCTAFPQSNASPIVTVPVAGKLTSSTTTYFRPEEEVGVNGDGPDPLGTSRSVDGLFHPSPPPYRYGFTPGGQYVDFFNLPTLCTTQPLSFQRESVNVKIDGQLANASKEAEAALESGDKSKAQAILEGAAGE